MSAERRCQAATSSETKMTLSFREELGTEAVGPYSKVMASDF